MQTKPNSYTRRWLSMIDGSDRSPSAADAIRLGIRQDRTLRDLKRLSVHVDRYSELVEAVVNERDPSKADEILHQMRSVAGAFEREQRARDANPYRRWCEDVADEAKAEMLHAGYTLIMLVVSVAAQILFLVLLLGACST